MTGLDPQCGLVQQIVYLWLLEMTVAANLVLHLLSGWLAGKAYALLMRASRRSRRVA